MSLHWASWRQSFVHVPALHVAAQTVSSLQSKLQKFELHVALHLAVSSHSMLQGPALHARRQVLPLSQCMLHGGFVQTNSHVESPVHVQLPEHSSTSGVVPASERPPSASLCVAPASPVWPLEPPELEEVLLAPEPPSLPIVQSYEHAPRVAKERAMATVARRIARS